MTEECSKDTIKQQTQRIHDLNNKLKSIDNMMVERIKHAKWCKEAASSNTSRKREGYREHALSEALGEIRKITKGKT